MKTWTRKYTKGNAQFTLLFVGPFKCKYTASSERRTHTDENFNWQSWKWWDATKRSKTATFLIHAVFNIECILKSIFHSASTILPASPTENQKKTQRKKIDVAVFAVALYLPAPSLVWLSSKSHSILFDFRLSEQQQCTAPRQMCLSTLQASFIFIFSRFFLRPLAASPISGSFGSPTRKWDGTRAHSRNYTHECAYKQKHYYTFCI